MAAKSVVFSHWFHLLEGLQESPQSFYATLEAAIKKRELPDVVISRIDYKEGGMFSAKREYCRVKRKKLIFDVCAAPFGRGFFISWWLGEIPSFLRALFLSIPVFGIAFSKIFKPSTYFQQDTELMFQESVHAAVLETVDQMVQDKGLRALSESERKPIMGNLFKR
ncbi:MAG: hypothetical protein WAV76_08470 [Bacteroidota bacterium]